MDAGRDTPLGSRHLDPCDITATSLLP